MCINVWSFVVRCYEMKLPILFVIITMQLARCEYYDERPENVEKCAGNVELMERRCCKLPPFYSQAISRTCGALLSVYSVSNDNQTVYMRRNFGNRCDYWKCVLQKYKLLDDKERLSVDKFFEHLDRWIKLNPLFEEIIEKAKPNCKDHYRNDQMISACNYFALQSCIRHFITLDCPDLIDSPACREQKAFYDECREHFL